MLVYGVAGPGGLSFSLVCPEWQQAPSLLETFPTMVFNPPPVAYLCGHHRSLKGAAALFQGEIVPSLLIRQKNSWKKLRVIECLNGKRVQGAFCEHWACMWSLLAEAESCDGGSSQQRAAERQAAKGAWGQGSPTGSQLSSC